MSNTGNRSVDAFGEWVLRRSLAEDHTSVDPRPSESHSPTPSLQASKAILPTAHCGLPSPSPTESGLPPLISDQRQCPGPDQLSFTRQHKFVPPKVKPQPGTMVGAPALLQTSPCGPSTLREDSSPAQSQEEVGHSESRSQHGARLVSSKRKKLQTPNVNRGKRPSSRNRNEHNQNISIFSSQTTATTKRQSKMLRELYPHNDGPPIGIHPSIGLHTPSVGSDEDSRPLRITRTEARNYQRRTTNQPETPQKSLNVRRMMREQLQGSSKKFKVSVSSPTSSKVQSPLVRSRSGIIQPILVNRGVPISSEVSDHYYSSCWKGWEDSKESLDQHLRSPMLPERESKSRRPFDIMGPLSLQDCSYVIDDDAIYIFKPTRQQCSCFAKLLSFMERTAGRAQGVVKVVVPEACTSPHEDNDLQPNILGDVQVPIYSTTLSQCPSSQKAHVYLVNTDKVELGLDDKVELGLAPAVRVLDKIQEELAHWLKKLGNTGFEDYSVWRRREETQFTGRDMRFTEKDMKDCLMKAASTLPWSVIDEPATPELRKALECDDLHLGEDASNGFLQSATVEADKAGPSLARPSFHCSTRSGTIFPMQLGDFAAHTLIYHHSGGPRTYVIVKPSSHRRLEEFVCLAFQRGKIPKPPTCSEFVSHESVYIPKDTLVANGIEFTEVTQFERELLIIFPYAYYQGFNGAANVVEEMMYASKSWEVFHREGLYVKCNKNCAEGEEEFDLSFAEQSDVAQDLSSSDHGIRKPASRLRKPEVVDEDEDSDHNIRPPASKRQCAQEVAADASVSDHDIRPPASKFQKPEVADETSDSDHDIRPPASKRRCAQKKQLPNGNFPEGKEKSPEDADEDEDSDYHIRAPASKRRLLQEE